MPEPGSQTDRDAEAVVSFVATRDAPCPVCSYNLRGLKAAVCPECAAKLHLQVGSENLRLGAWFMGCISLALALGFDGVVSVVMGVVFVLHPPPGPAQFRQVLTYLACFVFLALCAGLGVMALFRKRRAFTRLSRPRQWQVAWTILAIVFGVHLLYGAIVTGIL